MFKFLKKYENRANLWALVLFITLFFYFDYFDGSEQREQLEEALALLAESSNRVETLFDSTQEMSNMLNSSIEFNKSLMKKLESDNENFIQLEQRIASLQELMNNTDLNSSDLTVVRFEIADILQYLKRANETRKTVLSE